LTNPNASPPRKKGAIRVSLNKRKGNRYHSSTCLLVQKEGLHNLPKAVKRRVYFCHLPADPQTQVQKEWKAEVSPGFLSHRLSGSIDFISNPPNLYTNQSRDSKKREKEGVVGRRKANAG